MSKYESAGGRLVTPTTVFLAALVAIAAYYVAVRFIYGMGAVTNLNDGYSWGIWVVYDVVIGTGLACGGYAMALLVYVFNKGEHHPLVRPALLASVFGYSLGGAAVLVDLGRWWNFWHILSPAYFNPNSVMFEVAVCIALYICVLWLEFSPSIFERLGWKRAAKRVNKIMWVLVALGCLFPMMHQSSLGSLLIVMGAKVDPRWHTMLLPLLFLLSAISMGFAVVMFEATLSAEGFRRPREVHMLKKLAAVLAGILAVYLVVRFGDLAWRGQIPALFQGDFLARMFWLEIALFALPIALFLSPAMRESPRALFVGSVSMLLAASLYRIDGFLVALTPNGDAFSYFPSVPELMVSIGMIAFEILAYIVLARLLPVMHAHEAPKTPAAPVLVRAPELEPAGD